MDKKEQAKQLVDKWEKLGLLNGLTLDEKNSPMSKLLRGERWEIVLKNTPLSIKKIALDISKSVIKK